MECIFFVHKGKQPYVKTVIERTRNLNPDCEIVILGNETNEKISGCKLEMINDYYSYASNLENKYVNYSPNAPEFELFCMTRWMVIYEYMVKNNIDIGCHYDSDVINLIPADFSLAAHFCLCYDGGHVCYFTQKSLKKLCDMMLESYNQEIKHLNEIYLFRQRHNLLGGVHDLTFLWLYKMKYSNEVVDLSLVNNMKCYDHNINDSADGYEMVYGKKKIYFINGKYFFKDIRTLELVEVLLFHMSGRAKKYIENLCIIPEQSKDILVFDYNNEQWVPENSKNNESIFKKCKITFQERCFQVKKKLQQSTAMRK